MIEFNIIPQVIKALHNGMNKHVEETAQTIAESAASNAPEETGYLASTVYYQTANTSTYGQAGEPSGDSYLLPEMDTPGDQGANIGVAADYGEYVELGTRHMPAQPFLAPAVEQARSDWENIDLEKMILDNL